MARMSRNLAAALQLVLIGLAAPVHAQQDRPDLNGMWSDVRGTIEEMFCSFYWCADVGLDRLTALLDDPANDSRLAIELFAEAARHQREQYLLPRLTPAALATLGIDPADDTGFLYCEPWGFARQIFTPHQLQITQSGDRVEMHYGEWEARRTVYLDGRRRSADEPTTPLGFSVGHYEGAALVIETTGIRENLAPWGWDWATTNFDGKHSDELRVVERYTRSDEGDRLLLSATMEDPWSLREPIVLKKVWAWAPHEEISAYADCERPSEFIRGALEQ